MVAPWKYDYVNQLYEELKNAEMFGIANAMDTPSSALQNIRLMLADKANIKVVRKNLLIKALERLAEEKPEIKQIIDELEKNKRITVTLILPKEKLNSFKLYRLLDENKSYRKARPGDVAPEDIIIPAGPTNFTPGPILSELGRLGLKVAVEGGKVVVKRDKLVAKKGEVITPEAAELLSKFNIEPIEVKLALLITYENGIIYTLDVLAIDPQEYIDMLKRAFLKAVAVSVETGIPTKDSAKILFRKAFENAAKVSLKAGIPTKDTIELLLKRGIAIAAKIKEKVPDSA